MPASAQNHAPLPDYAPWVDHCYVDLVADPSAVEGGVEVLDVWGGGAVDGVDLVAWAQRRPRGGPGHDRLAPADRHGITDAGEDNIDGSVPGQGIVLNGLLVDVFAL